MTTRNTISHADEIYQGNVQYGPYSPDGRRGVRLHDIVYVNLAAPDTASTNGILDGTTVETDTAYTHTAGDLTLATMDVPRGLQLISTDQAAANNVFTVTGTDVYGETLIEQLTMNGTSKVSGKKAFKTLTSVVIATGGAAAGTADLGWDDVLGLPFRVDSNAQIFSPQADGSVEDFTVVVADTDQDATAGDNRGTVNPATACDDSVVFSCLIVLPTVNTKAAVFGVDQYSG